MSYPEFTEIEKAELEMFRQLMESLDYIFWIRDIQENRVIYVNTAFEKLWGISAAELYEDPMVFIDKVHPEDRSRIMEERTEVEGSTWRFEQDYRLVQNDGEIRWIRARTFPVVNCDGEVERLAGIAQDVTDEHYQRETMREMEERLRLASMVFDNSDEAILVTDLHACIIEVNPAFEKITGYSRSEVLGKNPSMMQSGKHSDDFYSAMWKSLVTTGKWQGEIWDRRKNGEIYPKWLTLTTVTDPNGTPYHYVGLFSDISRIKQSEQVLEHLAHYDPLTELPNRVLFRDRLGQAISELDQKKEMIALLFLDLDGFKDVNDSKGHTAGDFVLMETARRLSSVIRKTDTVARLGGDEFTVILSGITQEANAIQVAEKILYELRKPFFVESEFFRISASIGIAFAPRHGETVEELIRYSDMSMYRAKEAGKNQYFVLS